MKQSLGAPGAGAFVQGSKMKRPGHVRRRRSTYLACCTCPPSTDGSSQSTSLFSVYTSWSLGLFVAILHHQHWTSSCSAPRAYASSVLTHSPWPVPTPPTRLPPARCRPFRRASFYTPARQDPLALDEPETEQSIARTGYSSNHHISDAISRGAPDIHRHQPPQHQHQHQHRHLTTSGLPPALSSLDPRLVVTKRACCPLCCVCFCGCDWLLHAKRALPRWFRRSTLDARPRVPPVGTPVPRHTFVVFFLFFPTNEPPSVRLLRASFTAACLDTILILNNNFCASSQREKRGLGREAKVDDESRRRLPRYIIPHSY